jgi:hypothetical protein
MTTKSPKTELASSGSTVAIAKGDNYRLRLPIRKKPPMARRKANPNKTIHQLYLSNHEPPVTGRRSMTTVKVTATEGALVLPESSLATAVTVCRPASKGSSATKAQSP